MVLTDVAGAGSLERLVETQVMDSLLEFFTQKLILGTSLPVSLVEG